MAGFNTGLLGGRKSLLDYQTLQQEFQLQKQLAAQKLASSAAGQDLPAPLQLANEYQKRIQAGDVQGANIIMQFAKTQDKGLQVGADGTFGVLPGYAPAVAGIEGAKAGAKEQATSDVELLMQPKIAMGTQNAKNASDLNFNPQIKAATDTAASQAEADFKARSALPQAEDQYNNVTKLISDIETAPGLNSVVGARNIFKGAIPFSNATISGSPAADFQAKLDRLGGTQFLEAFQSLKGGGAITEIEGKKAENAIANMQTSQSEEQFKKSLAEFKGIVNQGITRARAKAGAQQAPAGGLRVTVSPSDARAELIRRGIIKQ